LGGSYADAYGMGGNWGSSIAKTMSSYGKAMGSHGGSDGSMRQMGCTSSVDMGSSLAYGHQQ